MPERFVRVMRGLDLVGEVTLAPHEEILKVEKDKGRNIDPKTGEPPTDDEGNELPILPEVFIIRVGEKKAAKAEAKAEEEPAEEPTRDELYARAQELDIPGRSEMNMEELAEAIEEAEKA